MKKIVMITIASMLTLPLMGMQQQVVPHSSSTDKKDASVFSVAGTTMETISLGENAEQEAMQCKLNKQRVGYSLASCVCCLPIVGSMFVNDVCIHPIASCTGQKSCITEYEITRSAPCGACLPSTTIAIRDLMYLITCLAPLEQEDDK